MRGVALSAALSVALTACAPMWAQGRAPSSAKGLIIGGAAILAFGYYFTAVAAHAASEPAAYVPIIGPYTALGSDGTAAFVALGAAQVVGAVLLGLGLVTQHHDDATRVDRFTLNAQPGTSFAAAATNAPLPGMP